MAAMINPTESEEQRALFRWAAYEAGARPALKLMYHIPNEGQRSRATGGRMKAEGLRPGVPDICLPVARGGYIGLYIELKRRKNGRLSLNQGEWLRALAAEGHCTAMCQGWDEARELIAAYLDGKVRRG